MSFSPDRPGFGDGTSVMAPWYFSFEYGMGLSTSSNAVEFEQGLLIRMGLTSWLELRLGLPGMLVSQQDGTGATDGALGTKMAFELFDGLGVSLSTMFGLPVTEETQDSFSLFNGISVSLDLSDTVGISVTGVATISQADADAEMGWEAGGAVSLGGSLGDDASVFFEGSLLTDQTGETLPSIALGATRMLTDTMQIDLFFQYDMPESGTAVTVGSGLAFML